MCVKTISNYTHPGTRSKNPPAEPRRLGQAERYFNGRPLTTEVSSRLTY